MNPGWMGQGFLESKGAVAEFARQKGPIVWMQTRPMIDLHCHILPGMDDGSPDVETSLAMLRRQAEQGIGAVCATPHYYARQNDIETFCERRAAALEKLQAAWPEEGLPRVLPAAEVAFFTGISGCPDLGRLCIQGTRTLLLEMPFTEWNDFQVEEVSALVLDRGFSVVLVHPERFCASKGNRERLRQMEQLPAALQVNAETLIRWRTHRLGLQLLREAQLPLLASDCHNLTTRPPNLAEGRNIIARKLGSALLDAIDQNAGRLIQPAAEKEIP